MCLAVREAQAVQAATLYIGSCNTCDAMERQPELGLIHAAGHKRPEERQARGEGYQTDCAQAATGKVKKLGGLIARIQRADSANARYPFTKGYGICIVVHKVPEL